MTIESTRATEAQPEPCLLCANNHGRGCWAHKQPAPATGGEPVPASTGRDSGCRMAGGICACRSGGSFGGCVRERENCCSVDARHAEPVAAPELDVEAERREFAATFDADDFNDDLRKHGPEAAAFGIWLAARVGSFLRSGSAAQGSAPTPIPAHLREFVEAVANEFDGYDDCFCRNYCLGCMVDAGPTRDDGTYEQPHAPGCIVLRAEALLASRRRQGIDMTDEELLKLAAKAVRAELHFAKGGGHPPSPWLRVPGKDFYWNPLTDDGDAFRLAVKLRLHLTSTPHAYIRAESQDRKIMREEKLGWSIGDDGATRRAIVSTAAEIGRSA